MRGRLAHVLPLLAFIAILPSICGTACAEVSTDDRAAMDDCLSSARQKNERQEVCIGNIQDSCAASETECAAREIAYWDDLLNKSYRQALGAGGGQSQALRALQRQWISWRDARCGYAATFNRKGASEREARDRCVAEETARRALELSATSATPRSGDYPIVTDDEVPIQQQDLQPSANAARPAPSEAVATASNSESGELLSQPPAWFGSFTPGPAEMQAGAPAAAAPPPAAPAESPQLAAAPQPEEQEQPPAEPPPITEIKVVVDNVQSSEGTVVVGLCDKDLSQDGCPYHEMVPASKGSIETAFKNIPPGRYAVAAFHDENDNQDLDRSGMVPKEPFALSNGASEKMVPTFQDAVMNIPKGETTVTLRLHLFGE